MKTIQKKIFEKYFCIYSHVFGTVNILLRREVIQVSKVPAQQRLRRHRIELHSQKPGVLSHIYLQCYSSLPQKLEGVITTCDISTDR